MKSHAGVDARCFLNANGSGVTVAGSTTGTLVLSGRLAAINAYLACAASPTYVPVANANGVVTLTTTTSLRSKRGVNAESRLPTVA